jgi:hypothetical protein
MYRIVVVAALCGGCSQLVMNPFHGGTLKVNADDCVSSRIPVAVDGVMAAAGAAASVALLATMPSSSPDDDGLYRAVVVFGQELHVLTAITAAALSVVSIVSASRGTRWTSECRRLERHRHDPPRDDIELHY